jgi:ribosome-associated heat shock protein Hsp15
LAAAAEQNGSGTIRLDKWLWQARFVKSRARAVALVESGAVRVNSARVQKAATAIRIGDGLSFALDGRVHVLRVRALGLRRGPAPEARMLYDDLEAAAGP